MSLKYSLDASSLKVFSAGSLSIMALEEQKGVATRLGAFHTWAHSQAPFPSVSVPYCRMEPGNEAINTPSLLLGP